MNSKFFKTRKPLLFMTFTLAAVLVLVMAAQITNAGLAKTKFLGNIIAGSVPSNFATYWNQVTPENSTKWGAVEGNRDSMNWSQADMTYNYARSNGMPFKFHTLVWGSQEPSWIRNLSAADQKAEVLEWIQAAGARYGDSQFVDVVNEPLHSPPSFKNAIGGDGSTGWDWVIWSFQEARRVFPNSKLLINEYGIISDPNAASRYLNIINILKSRGLVDGIGIQCHYFNMDTVSTSTMRSVLSSLAATGLPIYVSELDITGDDTTQRARYQEKFPVFWENSAVAGITLWGYIEGQTWASGTHLITRSGAERPALQWLRTYLASGPTATPTWTTTPGTVTPTPTSGPRSAFSQLEAESFNTQSGIQTESCSEGGQNIGYIENGDYVVYNNIDFGGGAASFQARAASATSGGNIEIRLDSTTGTLVGTCSVAGTGDWQTWVTSTCSVSGASGMHNLFLRFTGGSGYLFNLNWFKFTSGSVTPTPTPTPTIVRTPTPVVTPTPTIVRTPTSVITPTPTVPVTPTPGTPTPPGAIKVQFFNQSKTDPTNQLYLNFQFVNTGSSAVALSNVKMRYWYTEDGTQAQSFWCDYSTVGSSNVTGTFVKMGTVKTGADTYVEVGFTSGAGNLNAGASIQVQCRCAKSDWSNFTQSNDYSFNSLASSYVDWTKVTGYVSGTLAWGTEP